MSKVLASVFKKSIYQIGLSKEDETKIWDFYVTKSVAASASQKRTANDYGTTHLPWKEMVMAAGVLDINIKVLPANSINETLKKYELDSGKGSAETAIEIDVNKIICLTPYVIADENPPKPKIGNAESVLTHIRNAFAHGNTYFFDNGKVLLEDKNQSTVTARILIDVQTLLDWISIIDSMHRFY